MAKLPISAVIIVKDGERYLEQVLTPLVAVCDEVLLLDSGSTDQTLAIAERLGVRIAHQPFLGYGPQKRRAVALARHDWILSIDADEVLDERAASALATLDLSDGHLAWRVLRRNFVGSREVRHGVWAPDWCLRLFHRNVTDFTNAPVHEAVAPVADLRTLPGSLLHYSYRDCADVFARMGGYTRIKSLRYRSEGRRAGACQLALRAAWGFVRSFIFRLGFLDGPLGVVVALSVAVDNVVGLATASLEEGIAPENTGAFTTEARRHGGEKLV